MALISITQQSQTASIVTTTVITMLMETTILTMMDKKVQARAYKIKFWKKIGLENLILCLTIILM